MEKDKKIKLVWKIVLLSVLAAGVALGCCDLDCLTSGLTNFIGL